MDQIYSVPVKSLVATEEDEEEYEEDYMNGYSSEGTDDNSFSPPSSVEEESSSSRAAARADYRYILKNSLEGSLYHLFLPKRIPDCAQPDLLDIEVWMLQQCSEILSEILQPFPSLGPISKMFTTWISSQPKNIYDRDRVSQMLSLELKNMKEGDTIPVYVRKQNATILFSKFKDTSGASPAAGSDQRKRSDEPSVLVETFRPCLPSETVMSTVGSLQMTYPETSDVIYNTEMLCSQMFAKQLHELSVEQFEVAMKISTKADREFVEHREVSDPFLVSDWIVALLVPSSGTSPPGPALLKIKKKVRDEVNCKRSAQAIPFRRSGMWTSIKVALHLKLLKLVGNELEARILYKCLLLRILATITHHHSERAGKGIQLDLCGQLIGKLGRRVKKLQKMTCDKNSPFAKEIVHFWSTSVKFVQIVVSALHKKMNEAWKEACEPSKEDLLEPIRRTSEEFQDDLLHIIPWLNKFILKEINAKAKFSKGESGKKEKTSPISTMHPSPLHTNSKLGTLERLDRFKDLESIVTSHEEIISLKQMSIWRSDTESFIKYHCDPETFGNDTNKVMELAMIYTKEAFLGYTDTGKGRGDPVGFSQLILATLRLAQIMDQIATLKFPLLLEYKSGINLGKFYKLLLPHSSDMKLLSEISEYFLERDKNAKYPGLLDKLMEHVAETSFPSRFAAQNEEMSKLREKIVQEMNVRIEERLAQVEKARLKCLKLQEQLEEKKKSCEECKGILKSAKEAKEEEGEDEDPTFLEGLKCEECLKLEEELEEKRYSVSVYERPLPTEEHLQYAVIFELVIPDEIKNLREIIGLIKFDFLREQQKKLGTNVQINWTDYRSLKKYRKGELATQAEFLHANLSSKFLPTSTTHHTLIKNPDVLNNSTEGQKKKKKKDEDESQSPFIVPNGLDCVYHYTCRNFMGSLASFPNPLIKCCTFQLSTTEQKGDANYPDDPYQTLQWALDTTTHSQNRIISEYSSTHHPELIAFGSLRVGHRIQLMNLYRYIANRQLQFEKEPVIALLLQTLWEVGPRLEKNEAEVGPEEGKAEEEDKGDRKLNYWESHLDFMDLEFTEEFLELLEKLVESNDTNYANPLVLLGAVVITVRILEINRSYRERCYKLLKTCRRCSERWLEMIQNEIASKTEEMEERDEEVSEQEQNLRKLQLEIAIASALTYNVSGEGEEDLFQYVVQDGEDLMHWYETLSRLYELAPADEKGTQNKNFALSKFMERLLDYARKVPLKLKLEQKLNSKSVPVKFNDLLVKSLHLFGCLKWDWSATAGTWKVLDEAPNIVLGRYQSQFLTFDMLQGEFLVNGFCRSGMPTSIVNSPLYDLYFRGTKKLKVVQVFYSDWQTNKSNVVIFRTSDKFHGKHYEFEVHASTERVRIREVREDEGTKLELVNPEKFRGTLADEFIYQFTHWIDFQNKVVFFRRVPQKDSDYSLKPEYKLVMDEKTGMWLLHDELHDTQVFSRKSQGFQLISKALSRLEVEKYINVIMKSDGEVVAKLPRHHLNFNLDSEEGRLVSGEYKDFKISLNQVEKGTLVGLRHGLLLENTGAAGGGSEAAESSTELHLIKKILLVPHGNIVIDQSSQQWHQQVRIELNHLRQPSFFLYEIDPVLKRLKGDRSKCAWLFLAALHAATSSCSPSLPDPFTGLTGNEMSMQILQSGFVWSCSPYDLESLQILKIIRSFAPRREYYGHGMRSPLRSPTKGNGKRREHTSPQLELKEEQMETTEWPSGLPSMSAYDGYAIIVDRLIEDSNRLSVLFPSQVHGEMKEFMVKNKSSEKLQVRAYYRHLGSYNKASLVKPNFLLTPVQKLNETADLPEFEIRKRHSNKDSDDDGHGSEKFQLDFLLRLSQARFIMTLEDPLNGSKRESDLSKFIFSQEGGESQALNQGDYLLPALPIPNATISGVPIKHLLDSEFKQNWLKFYMMAVQWTNDLEEKQAFSIVLSALAYQGAPVGQLLNLHNVSVLAQTINFPIPHESIQTCSFTEFSNDHDFSELWLRSFLEHNARSSYLDRIHSNGNNKYGDNDDLELEDMDNPKLKLYEGKLKLERKIDEVISKLKEDWPCERIPRKKMDEIYAASEKLWTIHDLKQINLMINQWYRNFRLKQFVDNVESYLNKFYEHFPNIPKHDKQFDSMRELSVEVKLVPPEADNSPFDHISTITISGELDEPGVIFFSGSAFQETTSDTLIPTQREQCINKIDKYLKLIHASISEGNSSKQAVSMSGLAPRTNPILLLQYLIHGLKSPPGSVNPGFLKLLGAIAVLWTELKRFNRIVSLMTSKATAAAELKSELENPGHEDWSPVDHPEWLILELELDIMIRPVQVEVAKQMISMPKEKNGVMQLNMGEGKTSVIVPMLCVACSKEQDSLCRVTVLNSIFKTNFNLLSYAVGGLVLSRRVYTFPCRRDTNFNLELLDEVLKCYQECLKQKGVVLTLPEYRLSFRLVAFDQSLKGYPEKGVKFLEIENGLRRYCRDILDESDELLNVKYQLVYTIGMQVPVDGGNLRWLTCQKLLQIVQDVAWVFLTKMGPTSVEFHKDQQQRHPEQFAHIRLLDEEAHEELVGLIADELLKELKLTERQKQVVKRFLTQERISQENFKFVLSLFKNDAAQLDEIRLLSGYLRRGILALALTKRWRVEYGVDPLGSHYRRMAVPFRAKDFAAERTEFGHPDLAIILTHLSYYYSGLKDSELEECFDILKNKPEADSIYSFWIGRFSPQEKVPKFLISYAGFNIQDAYQRQTLFSLLRRHKSVIDFWLSHKVFPEECKQFPGKIVMNAWDLCYEKQRLPITGFSGTNDSSLLLPLPVTQQDLEVLQDTNRKMEQTLLQPINSGHKGLSMNVSCREILEEMKKDCLKVLIDAGALMLELNNEQVAKLWLDIDPEIEAAVYFSKDNEILVKCRKESEIKDGQQKNKKLKSPQKPKAELKVEEEEGVSDIPLELSPYRERLERCGVFLDDQHTRGTDLKFPSGSKACVTIGSRMRRDKLMQACMRMRQLGNGHSVTFYLSHEAHSKVLKCRGKKGNKDTVGTEDIIHWTTLNTQEFNKDGLIYWALAGKNYAQKLAAQEFHDSVDTHPLEKIYTLSKQCLDDEVLSLKDMYGTYTEAELLTKLIPEWFEQTQRKLLSVEGCYSLSQVITKRYDWIRNQVQKRCEDHIPDRKYLSGGLTAMEEEQEKEIEMEREAEAEEERQIVQERKLDYVRTSSLHENVRQAVLKGKRFEEKEGISKLSDIFEKTSFSKLLQPEGWMGAEVYATTDFVTVVKPMEGEEDSNSHFKTDSHLRPIEFVVSLRPQPISTTGSRKSIPMTPTPLQCLVLSPFEVNELMPYFRSGRVHTHLHMFTPRLFPNQNILLNNGSLQVPRPLTLQSQKAPVLLNIIPDGSKCLAALYLASGNLYFVSMEEQKTFAKFLGLVPRPWTSEQMNAFEKEMIKKTGFLLPKFRRQQMDSCQIEQGAFQKDPIPLVRKILMCRHAVVSDVTHVSRLLNQNWYVDLN